MVLTMGHLTRWRGHLTRWHMGVDDAIPGPADLRATDHGLPLQGACKHPPTP